MASTSWDTIISIPIGTPFVRRCRRREDGKYIFWTEIYKGKCATISEMMPELEKYGQFSGRTLYRLTDFLRNTLARPQKIVTPIKKSHGKDWTDICYPAELWDQFFDIVRNRPSKLPSALRKALKPQA